MSARASALRQRSVREPRPGRQRPGRPGQEQPSEACASRVMELVVSESARGFSLKRLSRLGVQVLLCACDMALGDPARLLRCGVAIARAQVKTLRRGARKPIEAN